MNGMQGGMYGQPMNGMNGMQGGMYGQPMNGMNGMQGGMYGQPMNPGMAQRPSFRCDKCGWVPEDPNNIPRFCPECGDPFDQNDMR